MATEVNLSSEQILGIERTALKVSIGGAFLMSILGVSFALLTGSEAIMLDGVFSAIGVVMGMATLHVAHLVNRSDDETFPFGYAHFAPLINVFKSMLMVTLCGFALLSSVMALLGDGRELVLGSAVIYGAIATTFGALLAWYLRRSARLTGSEMVDLDAKSALVDTFMSAAVLASFALAYLVSGSDWATYLNYLDPAVVAVLCLFSLPVPLKVLWQSSREVLLMAPGLEIQQQVKDRVAGGLEGFPVIDYRMRVLKMGSVIYVLVHVQPGPGGDSTDLLSQDEWRRKINKRFDDMQQRVTVDVVFLGDILLADQAGN